MRRLAGLGLILVLGWAAASVSAQTSPTLTLNPNHGRVGSVTQATYRDGRCASDSRVRFYWNNQRELGNASISDPNTCTASTQLSVPNETCGRSYTVQAQLFTASGAPVGATAQATFRLDCVSNPSPKPTTAPPTTRPPTTAPPKATRSAVPTVRATTASPLATRRPPPVVRRPTPRPSPTRSEPPDTAPREDPNRDETVTLSAPDDEGGGTSLLPWAVGAIGVLAAWSAIYVGMLRPRRVDSSIVAGTGTAAVLVAVGLLGLPALLPDDTRPTSVNVVRHTSDVTIALGETGSVEASCPGGHRPIGGGYHTDWIAQPRPGDVARFGDTVRHYREHDDAVVRFGPRVTTNRPTPAGWRVEALNPSTNTRALVVSASVICARGVGDFSIRSAEPTSIMGNAVGTSTVGCRAGNLLAIGWETVNVIVDTTVERSGGSVTAMSDAGDSGGVQAVALCGTVPSYAIATADSTSVAASAIGRVAAQCPEGRTALGGAYAARRKGRYDPPVYQYVTPTDAYPDDASFAVAIYNHRVPKKIYPAEVRAWAICARTG